MQKQLIKKETDRCFPMNVAKFLRKAFLQNSSKRLLRNMAGKIQENMLEKRQGIEKKTIFSKEVEKKQGNKKNNANLHKKAVP